MNDCEYTLEALKMISDWTKWIVTIETLAIPLLGTLFTKENVGVNRKGRIFGVIAILCFVVSICFAAMLLLTLPEIIQSIKPGLNIWLTEDRVIGNLYGLNTQWITAIISMTFGFGILYSAATIATIIWPGNNNTSKKANRAD